LVRRVGRCANAKDMAIIETGIASAMSP